MSVCRFSEGAEERRTFKAHHEETMIAHLDEHISAGHAVPADAFDRLREEIASRVQQQHT